MNETIDMTIPRPKDLISCNFIKGIRLILLYQPDARITIIQHDTLCFGDGSYDMFTEEDKLQMEKWGWYCEVDTWAINV